MSTINIAPGHVLRGAFETQAGDDVSVNGPGKFAPNAFVDNGNATINADVIGRGSFITSIGSNLTFTGSVGYGESVYLGLQATITIDDPKAFKGEIGFVSYSEPNPGPFGEYVDLGGLANAAGYSLKNDLLRITTSDGKVIDTLRLQHGVSPQQVVEDAGSVYLTWGYGDYRIPGGVGAGTVMPQHG